MSSGSSEDLDPETFGPLLSISESSLVTLATKIRAALLNHATSSPLSGHLVRRVVGSYNLVHIIQLENGFKLVIRVPATGWGDGLTATAARAMESQAATLRFIGTRTTIPIPQVYAFDPTTNNDIGAPYICMSFIPGRTLTTAWFDSGLPTPLEDRRLRTLTTLARALAQLAQFSFPKIGSVHTGEDGDLTVDSCYDWEENEDGTMRVVASGPYDTAAAYLRDHYASGSGNAQSVWRVAETKVMDAVVRHLPFRDSAEGFVLSVPDLDSQNILVDDEGNLTGLIDWDLVQTLPRCVGYCRYPGWITRDWDPLMYGWPRSDSENSPEELARYRMHYNQAMGEAMLWTGDWEFTRKSHLWEAIWVAVLNNVNRLEICCKLVQEATGNDKDSARGLMYDIGTGEADWPRLEKQLEAFIAGC